MNTGGRHADLSRRIQEGEEGARGDTGLPKGRTGLRQRACPSHMGGTISARLTFCRPGRAGSDLGTGFSILMSLR